MRGRLSSRRVRSEMAGIIYNLLLLAGVPFTGLYFLWRIFVEKKANESWRNNLGNLPKMCKRPPGSKLIWLHAVSAGEIVASLALQDEIRRLMPDCKILVTTITQTGNALARKSCKSADEVAYLPVDYPLFVHRALDRVRPDAIVLMEAEFWPNLLMLAKQRGILVVLANGRILDRTMRRPVRRFMASWAASNIDYCCMQTKSDAERILSLGASDRSVRLFGSTKFDQEGGSLSDEAVSALRSDLGLPDAPVFVAGSTNPGEDKPVLQAFGKLRQDFGDLRLVIAPRQIERADEVQSLAEAEGFQVARRSKGNAGPDADVLILDTFGELARTYAVGKITFVGGTLISKGGHSLVQPILQGKPVLFGPHTFKTADIAQMAIAFGVGFQVQDADELASKASELLRDPYRLDEINSACRRLVAENHGASTRCAELVVKSLAEGKASGS